MEKKQKNTEITFLFLCLQARQEVYQMAINKVSYKVAFVETVEEVIEYCVKHPPAGILLDAVTTMKIGPKNMAPIHHLGVSWPILVCNVATSEKVQILGLEKGKQEDLSVALDKICAKDNAWKHPSFVRKYLRMDVQCRIRIKLPGDSLWHKGNCLNMSVGGIFIVTHVLPEVTTNIEVEIYDIKENPFICPAQVAWMRRWEDSVFLPGIGVAFHEGTLDPAVSEYLARIQRIKQFCKQLSLGTV